MDTKLFDLIPVLTKIYPISADKSKIECFAYCNTILYIGTNDGFILRYSVNKSRLLQNKISYESELIDFKPINHKKPIIKIEIHESIQKLIYLSDNVVSLVNLYDLQAAKNDNLKIKNAVTFHTNYLKKIKQNSNLKFYISTKDDKIQVYIAKNIDTFILKNEISIDDTCIYMDSNEKYLCLACKTKYMIINTDDLKLYKILSYDFGFNPSVCSYLEEGFLLNIPGNYGKVVYFTGDFKLEQFDWIEKCIKFKLFYPYVICMTRDSIKIFNLITFNIIQKIQFIQGEQLIYFEDDNIILVSTASQIFSIDALPVNIQIENLIKNNQNEDAISLFKNTESNISKEKKKELQKIIGYIALFENKNYEYTKKLFIEANLSYDEIIWMIPNYSNKFVCYKEELSYISSEKINTVLKHNTNEIKEMILEYMLELKDKKSQEYVEVLLNLCADIKPSLLNTNEFYDKLPTGVLLEKIQILKDHHFYHAIALIYSFSNKIEDALNIWKDLVDEKINDIYFPGFNYVIEFLSKLQDTKLVWNYIDWAMFKNQNLAVKIFTERPSLELTNERMRPEIIVDFLKSYKTALVIYLEHLVFTKQIQKEKYHTYLGQIYIDDALLLLKQGNLLNDEQYKINLDFIRSKLQQLLTYSSVCRIQLLIDKIHGFEDIFQKELSLMYSKLGDHDRALEIIIHKLNDYKLAIDYCINNSNNSKQLRKKLFSKLLSVFITKKDTDLSEHAIELLETSKLMEIDLSKTIETIPANWSLNKITVFLQRNLIKLKYNQKRVLIKKSLNNYQNLCMNKELMILKNKKFVLNEQSLCTICNQPLTINNFYIRADGLTTHSECL